MIPTLVLGQAIAMIGAQGAEMQVWQLDPLEAVFRETPRAGAGVDPYDVARGEVAEWQVVVRCDQALDTLKASASTMRLQDGQATLGKPKCRFIGMTRVNKPPTWASSTQLKRPPADFPDPLLVDPQMPLQANQTQAIWVDLPIPKGTTPGLYTGTVTVTGTAQVRTIRGQMAISARVYPVFVGKNRLKSTNWFFPWPQFLTVPTRKGETQADAQIRLLAQSLAAHRQNVATVSAMDLATFAVGKDGRMTVDFRGFDRRVRQFMDFGLIGTIEGFAMGTRNGWAQPNLGIIRVTEGGKVVQKVVEAKDPAVERFYAWFLPLFLKHLKDKGWADIYLQHIVDEPCDENVESYRLLSDIAKKYLPGIRRLDTCCGTTFEGLMDVYSPELDYLNENYELFKKFQRNGKELWFYTCWKPQGEYANRLIEEPLIKTRLLHWIHFKYGITGYLHWGYDYWPYNQATDLKNNQFTHDYSPGGDGWIVYPGKGVILDSRRNESMRDGLADHELLSLLADRDPAAAQRIAARVVLALDKYVLDVPHFRAARREALEALSRS